MLNIHNSIISSFYKKEITQFLVGHLGDTALIDKWWSSKNKAFEGKTPLEMLEENPTKVADYVLKLV